MHAAAILDASPRCLLAGRGRRDLLVWPMAHWFDGEAVWMTAAADSGTAAALRRDAACALAVAPADDRPGMVATGRARVFTPAEPLRFALHAPAISAAMSALAARHASALWHYATHVADLAGHWPPHHQVVLRVAVDALATVEPPTAGPGVSPSLPTALPTDVRRRLGGQRVVMALWDQPPLRLATASWAAGLALTFPTARARPQPGDRVAVAAGVDGDAPTQSVGAVLHGELADGDVLDADRVTWWRGFEVHRTDLAAPAGGVAWPDRRP